MEGIGFFKLSGFVAMGVVFTTLTAFAGPTLQNGDFSAGLNGWTVEHGIVTDGGGYALFEEDYSSLSSTLSQKFSLPIGSQTLSFEWDMEGAYAEDWDPLCQPDAFTASLLDPVTFDPLISNPGSTEFYYYNNYNVEQTVGTVSGDTVVVLDVSALAGKDVFLSFGLSSGLDGLAPFISLDNVKVSVIPAPGALLLSLIGTGLAVIIRKSRVGKLI